MHCNHCDLFPSFFYFIALVKYSTDCLIEQRINWKRMHRAGETNMWLFINNDFVSDLTKRAPKTNNLIQKLIFTAVRRRYWLSEYEDRWKQREKQQQTKTNRQHALHLCSNLLYERRSTLFLASRYLFFVSASGEYDLVVPSTSFAQFIKYQAQTWYQRNIMNEWGNFNTINWFTCWSEVCKN